MKYVLSFAKQMQQFWWLGWSQLNAFLCENKKTINFNSRCAAACLRNDGDYFDSVNKSLTS